MQPRDRDEYLEYKRLAEQRRRAKIKRDAELHEVVKAKARARYHKRKAEKKIIPISEMTSQQKNKVRKQNRIKSRLYRKRMKERKNAILNFTIITRLHWYFPNLVSITWNYSESGHGKGAPDGVGGTLKRTADRVVARGHDIPNLETLLDVLRRNIKGVIIEKVEESSIFEKDMLMPATLPNFRGTMGVHQVVWHVNNIDSLTMRKLSCSLDECAISPVECTHGQHVGFYILKNSPEQNQNKDIITEPISRKLTKPSRVQILSDERINLSVSAAKRNLTENQNYTAPGSSSCNKKTTRVSPTKDLSLPLPLDDSFWQSVSSVDANCPSVSNIIFSTLNINDEDAINDDDDEDVDNLRIF